ncbi:unnamed protein product, partial [Hymenolepis diminuta]
MEEPNYDSRIRRMFGNLNALLFVFINILIFLSGLFIIIFVAHLENPDATDNTPGIHYSLLVFGILGLVTPGVGALAFYKSSAVILVIYLISIIIVAIVE